MPLSPLPRHSGTRVPRGSLARGVCLSILRGTYSCGPPRTPFIWSYGALASFPWPYSSEGFHPGHFLTGETRLTSAALIFGWGWLCRFGKRSLADPSASACSRGRNVATAALSLIVSSVCFNQSVKNKLFLSSKIKRIKRSLGSKLRV